LLQILLLLLIKTQIRDPTAIQAACRRLGLQEPTQGTAQLYDGEASGLLLLLPEWRYPVVIDVQMGEIKLDNFEGRWGEQPHLDEFLQAYSVERAKLEARKRGHVVTEQTLEDGSIKLRIAEAA